MTDFMIPHMALSRPAEPVAFALYNQALRAYLQRLGEQRFSDGKGGINVSRMATEAGLLDAGRRKLDRIMTGATADIDLAFVEEILGSLGISIDAVQAELVGGGDGVARELGGAHPATVTVGRDASGEGPAEGSVVRRVPQGPDLLNDRIMVPVVEVAGGPSGRASIPDHTLYWDYLTADAFVLMFGQPPPTHTENRWRFAIGLLRGESMVPRYYDSERVPFELFEEPRSDVPGGDVYLVRLDGHLHLKLVDRLPKTKKLPARYNLKSYNAAYSDIEVRFDEGVDFAALGRVVESNKQREFGALLARYLKL